MRNKISKLFYSLIFFGALLTSLNLYAQNVQGPSRLGEPATKEEFQVRLFALQLCKNFYEANAGEYTSKLENYIASIQEALEGAPAYIPGAIENYVVAHRDASALAQRYIKCQAIVAFPQGFNMSPQALADIQAELDAIALEISEIK